MNTKPTEPRIITPGSRNCMTLPGRIRGISGGGSSWNSPLGCAGTGNRGRRRNVRVAKPSPSSARTVGAIHDRIHDRGIAGQYSKPLPKEDASDEWPAGGGMTSIESRSYCRVVVIAPSTRVDLALPADVPIIDLLPMLLQYAGEIRDDGGGQHGGWKLTRVGYGELEGGRTLRSLDVADGEVLRLVAREERELAPVFDDIVDAIATSRRDRINTRSVNPGLGAGVIVATMAVAALTVVYRGAEVVDAYIAAGIAIALLGLATAVAKGTGDRILATATAASGLPFVFVCGLNAVTGDFGRWGVLLGAALAFVYALGSQLALGTGTVVFAGAATVSLLTALSALVAGLADVTPLQVVAGTIV